MTPLRIKQLARLIAVIMVFGSLLTIGTVAWMPLKLDVADVNANPTDVQTRTKPASATPPTVADYENYVDAALRRPLPKPPPPASPPVVTIVQPVETTMQFLGTVTEAGHNYAMFRTSDGVEFKRSGQIVSGATITDIRAGVVQLRQPHGEVATLRVPQPRSP